MALRITWQARDAGMTIAKEIGGNVTQSTLRRRLAFCQMPSVQDRRAVTGAYKSSAPCHRMA